MDWFVGYDCTRQKPQPLIRNYMEMLGVELMYDNQPHDKHGFQMKYKMHENYRNKMKNLHFYVRQVRWKPITKCKNKCNLKLSTNMASTLYMLTTVRSWA